MFEVTVWYGAKGKETVGQRETFATREAAERFAAARDFAGDKGYVEVRELDATTFDSDDAATRRAAHEAAGLGEAPSFVDVMDGIAAATVKARMEKIVADGRGPDGRFMGRGSFAVVDSRKAGYR